MSFLRRACTCCRPSTTAQIAQTIPIGTSASFHTSTAQAAWEGRPSARAAEGDPSSPHSQRPPRRPLGVGKPQPGKAHRQRPPPLSDGHRGGSEGNIGFGVKRPLPSLSPPDLRKDRIPAAGFEVPSFRPKPSWNSSEKQGIRRGDEGDGVGRRFGGANSGGKRRFGLSDNRDGGGGGGFGKRGGGDGGREGGFGIAGRARDEPQKGGFGMDRSMSGPRHDAGQRNDRGQGVRSGRSRDGAPDPDRVPVAGNARTSESIGTATVDDPSPIYDETDYTPSHRSRGAGPRGSGTPGRGTEGEKTSRSYREGGAGEFTLSRGRDRAREEPRERGRGADREAMLAHKSRVERGKKEVKEVEVKIEKKVFVPSSVSVGRLADIFGVKIFNLQRTMQRLGLSEDQRRSDYLLTSEEACNIALEYGLDPTVDDERTFDIFPEPEQEGVVQPLRPPVVTIMGHVDHGKTTLLDSLRHSSVATGEAGGITQHIGAFSVPLSSLLPSTPKDSDTPGTITFLDTPGHAAFTAMRARGASVTDMIVLVVAADDGVMPQTREVIELWKADQDKVGLVVAINKCDKPGIDFDKIKSALGAEGILLEEDGGDIPSVRVSGLKGEGLDKLVETLSTLAEIRELRARNSGKAEGYVLESRVDRGQGNVATVLVSKGTLTAGTCIVAGTTWARVRQMQDSAGRSLRSAPPGTPVSIMGWREIPHAGDQLLEASSEDEAKKAITNRLREIENRKLLVDVESINNKRVAERKKLEKEEEEIAAMKEAGKTEAEIQAWKRDMERAAAAGAGDAVGEGGKKELRLVIKGDVSGSVEAVVGSLEGIGNKEAGVKIVHVGVGEVGESDVHMAEAAGASIIAFSVPTSRSNQNLARSLNIPLHSDSVIYRLIETVRAEVIKLLAPVFETRVTGEATCQQIFEIKLKGKEVMRIAGCKVGNGVIEMKEGVGIRVLRGPERTQVYEGTIETLKHLKKDTNEVRKGTECGISFHGFTDVKEGDEIIAFTKFEVARHL